MFAGKKSAQIREILISESAWEEMTCLFAPSLDFLPLYDIDCLDNDNLEYDAYTQSEWKHNLFNHYLAVIYRYQDKAGKVRFCGSVVKTRAPSDDKDVEAISRRLIDFSPRLKKLAGVPCKVFVRTLTGDKTQKLTQDQCLRALHHLRLQSASKAQNA